MQISTKHWRGGWVAETSSLLNCRRSNPTASSNLVLSASNGCDSYRTVFCFYADPKLTWASVFGFSGKILGDWNKNIKKQPFSDASASHLSLVLWHVWFQAEAWISHTTSPTPPSYEVGSIAKRIKTARLRRKTKPGRNVILHVRP